MAIRINKSYSYVYILILLLLISGILFASATLVEDVCRQVQDKAFCDTVLGSDPRTRTADLPELARVVIDLASLNATGTEEKIHLLSSSAEDPKVIADLQICDAYYEDALTALKAATDGRKQGDFRRVNVLAAAVNSDASSCEASFEQPPTRESPLTSENNDLERLGDILMVISNFLLTAKHMILQHNTKADFQSNSSCPLLALSMSLRSILACVLFILFLSSDQPFQSEFYELLRVQFV